MRFNFLAIMAVAFLFACGEQTNFEVTEQENNDGRLGNQDAEAAPKDVGGKGTPGDSIDANDKGSVDEPGVADGESADEGGSDGGGSSDGGSSDGGMADAGTSDGGSSDGGMSDGGTTSGGSTDGGAPTMMGASETFNVVTNPKPVDLVLTVDNSGSMANEQVGLADRITSAFSHIQQTDYRVVLISTDRNDGIALAINKSDPGSFQDKMTALAAAISGFGTSGSGTERGIEQTVKALEAKPNAGKSWLREGSIVAALIVSDEDNCSDGSCAENAQWMINKLQGASINRVPGQTARVYGLHQRNANECQGTYNKVANTYMELIGLTGGFAGAICDPDYAPTLQQMSADIGVIAESTFELAHVPVANTVQAKINNVAYAGAVMIDGKRVTLSEANLGAGDVVKIDYSYVVPE